MKSSHTHTHAHTHTHIQHTHTHTRTCTELKHLEDQVTEGRRSQEQSQGKTNLLVDARRPLLGTLKAEAAGDEGGGGVCVGGGGSATPATSPTGSLLNMLAGDDEAMGKGRSVRSGTSIHNHLTVNLIKGFILK